MIGNLKDIILKLEQQKAAIEQALAVLKDVGGIEIAESSAPTGAISKSTRKKPRVMSEEGRRRIAEASRKRWAAHRKTLKKAAA